MASAEQLTGPPLSETTNFISNEDGAESLLTDTSYSRRENNRRTKERLWIEPD